MVRTVLVPAAVAVVGLPLLALPLLLLSILRLFFFLLLVTSGTGTLSSFLFLRFFPLSALLPLLFLLLFFLPLLTYLLLLWLCCRRLALFGEFQIGLGLVTEEGLRLCRSQLKMLRRRRGFQELRWSLFRDVQVGEVAVQAWMEHVVFASKENSGI